MKMFFVVISILSFGAGSFASELDNEINAFQVQLVNKKTGKSRPVYSRRQSVIVSQNSVSQAEASSEVVAANPTSYYEATRYKRKNSETLFKNIKAIPALTFSTFDGADNTVISPQGLGKSTSLGFGMGVSTDINLLNHPNLLIEGGVSYLSFGSYTGVNYVGNPQYDFLQLNYIGINLTAKWLFSGQDGDGLYAKAGATPLFLSSQNYSNLNSIYLNPTRFGNISSFDIALNLGLGYVYKLNTDLSLVLDVTGYQGLLPVMGWNVYNTGITTGIGASYNL